MLQSSSPPQLLLRSHLYWWLQGRCWSPLQLTESGSCWWAVRTLDVSSWCVEPFLSVIQTDIYKTKHLTFIKFIHTLSNLLHNLLTTSLTLLLYCLAQCGQQTGAVAIVPVSCVCVLNMGSGSPGAAGRSLRMLGGNSEPGWFFRIWAFLLLALL